jgi:hypothetical protein
VLEKKCRRFYGLKFTAAGRLDMDAILHGVLRPYGKIIAREGKYEFGAVTYFERGGGGCRM